MMGFGYGNGGMWLFGLLLLIGVVLLVVVGARALGGGLERDAPARDVPPVGRHGHARELLDERYARGELSTEEYRERMRILGEVT